MKRKTLALIAGLIGLGAAAWRIDCNRYALRPDPALDGPHATGDATRFRYDVPLDPASPWPKFRADARQSGRSAVRPARSDARPWTFATGKGVFSSPVIDGEGTAYIGSADHAFYAIRADGSLKWKFLTGEIIDSSALLDDRGRVYVPSGDAHLYALDRESGRELWRFRAHTPEQVEALHDIEVFNVDWWEGNVAMLADGTLLAGNDNYLYYRIDRDTGTDRGHLVSNELGWSLPAVNARTGRVFFGSMFVALRNLFAFDAESGEKIWSSGGARQHRQLAAAHLDERRRCRRGRRLRRLRARLRTEERPADLALRDARPRLRESGTASRRAHRRGLDGRNRVRARSRAW